LKLAIVFWNEVSSYNVVKLKEVIFKEAKAEKICRV